MAIRFETLNMERDISLRVRNFRKNEADSTLSESSNDHDDTVPEHEKENDQVEENEDEDNKGFNSIQSSNI